MNYWKHFDKPLTLTITWLVFIIKLFFEVNRTWSDIENLTENVYHWNCEAEKKILFVWGNQTNILFSARVHLMNNWKWFVDMLLLTCPDCVFQIDQYGLWTDWYDPSLLWILCILCHHGRERILDLTPVRFERTMGCYGCEWLAGFLWSGMDIRPEEGPWVHLSHRFLCVHRGRAMGWLDHL